MKQFPQEPEWFNGKWLTVVRKGRMLTKSELAAKCGLDCRRIGKIEDGKEFPPMDVIEKLAIALEWPIGIFFCDDPEVIDPRAISFRRRSGACEPTAGSDEA